MKVAMLILGLIGGLIMLRALWAMFVQRKNKLPLKGRPTDPNALELDLDTPLNVVIYFQNQVPPTARITAITQRHFQSLFSRLGHTIPNFRARLQCESCLSVKETYILVEYKTHRYLFPCGALAANPFINPYVWEQSLLVSNAIAEELGILDDSKTITLKKFWLLCPNDAEVHSLILQKRNAKQGARTKHSASRRIPELNGTLKAQLEEILAKPFDENNDTGKEKK